MRRSNERPKALPITPPVLPLILGPCVGSLSCCQAYEKVGWQFRDVPCQKQELLAYCWLTSQSTCSLGPFNVFCPKNDRLEPKTSLVFKSLVNSGAYPVRYSFFRFFILNPVIENAYMLFSLWYVITFVIFSLCRFWQKWLNKNMRVEKVFSFYFAFMYTNHLYKSMLLIFMCHNQSSAIILR